MGKIDSKKKQKKDALLNTAFDLFLSKGINKTSIADIVERAGVAKGTFYLYFKDKYDIRNRLVSHKASQLFRNAIESYEKEEPMDFENTIIYISDYVIDQLSKNTNLLSFISKNLSWGVFKNALVHPVDEEDVNFYEYYRNALAKSGLTFRDPEILLFMIIELIGSTCHSSILTKEPVDIETLKPHLYDAIHSIIQSQKITEKNADEVSMTPCRIEK